MARLFYTGFETGTWEVNGAISAGAVVSSTIKRTGSYSFAASANQSIRHFFDANKTELFVRFAYYVDRSDEDFIMWTFFDSAVGNQVSFQWTRGTQTIDLLVGGVIVDYGTIPVPVTTWIVVEANITVASSGGTVTTKINGTTNFAYTGNTNTTGVGNIRSVRIGTVITGGGGSSLSYYDDIAVNDEAGSYQASWIGLGGTFYLYPTADGAQNDWTPSAGTVNYAMVDERPPDNATTFNQALDSGDIDLYEVSDCPEYISEILCLQVGYRAALVTSGYNELTDLVRVGTVNYSGTEYTIVPITPAFTYYLGTIHYLNPSTGTVWGTVEVNAMQTGIEITT